MGKFSGILLCSDLDDTLLTTDKRVSDENKKAIEYFKDNGGIFTFATGRIPYGAKIMLRYIQPNAPMICFNGAGIYDFTEDRLIYNMKLHDDKISAVEFIDKNYDFSGIEICTRDRLYFSKMNEVVYEQKRHEQLPDLFADYHSIDGDWIKVLFMQKREEIQAIRDAFANSDFNDRFDFTQSSPYYYEMLPKGANKGNGLVKLGEILGIKKEDIIAVGDNENDIEMVKSAGVGIAVANAIQSVRDAADMITVDNNSNALACVIEMLS